MTFTTGLLIGASPVLIFLLLLIFLDSYKLVRFRSVLFTIFMGCSIAILCLGINSLLLDQLQLTRTAYSRYISPVIEESFKILYIVFLLRSKKIGFMVDAAILGFALGAGFAIVENIYYLRVLPDSNFFIWLVRGFGTAIMHGGATGIFAIISMGLSERRGTKGAWIYLPGLGVGIILHSCFNHFIISPVLSTVAMTMGVPVLMIAVFQQSERATRSWLGIGFDSDTSLMEMITMGNVSETPLGEYLQSLKSRFPGEVVADMLCLLRIYLELSVRAKGILLAREAGLDIPVDERVKGKFKELKYLEKSIGITGKLAVMPLLQWSDRELWQMNMPGMRK